MNRVSFCFSCGTIKLKYTIFYCLCSYDFVKYLRGYVESSLGTVVEDETKTLIRDGQHAIDSHLEALTHAVTQKTKDSAE